MQLYAPIANNEGPDAVLSATLAIDGLALSVTNTALMPGEGYVSIMRLGEVGEVVKVTGAAGNPYTIEREVDDTTAAEFTAGTELRHVETPTALRILINDAPNVFTERNDFTVEPTTFEKFGLATDETIEATAHSVGAVATNATAVQDYIQLGPDEAPPTGSTYPYGFRNADTNEFFIGYASGAIGDRIINVERGAFGSNKLPMTSGHTIEVLPYGDLGVFLSFGQKSRQKVLTNGLAIQIHLPDGSSDPNVYDGAEFSIGDNSGDLDEFGGGITLTDPEGSSVTITTGRGRIEAQYDHDTTSWTQMGSAQDIDLGLGVQRLTVRGATVRALPDSPAYNSGVLTSTGVTALNEDGVLYALGDLILVKNQVTAAHNGLYRVTRSDGSGYQIVRVDWMNENTELLAGVPIFVSEGNVNADTIWTLSSNGPFTIGTTDLNWVAQNGADVRADFTSNVATGANTTETDLHSWTAPANLLGKDGDKIVATFSGIFANNVNTKRLRLKYNASTILDTGILTGNAAGTWVIEVTIMRISSTSVRYAAKAFVNGVTVTTPVVTMAELSVTNHTATKILKVTGQNGSSVASDIVARMSTIEYAAAA